MLIILNCYTDITVRLELIFIYKMIIKFHVNIIYNEHE